MIRIKNFDMVFGFPLDYMHMACLGIMRRLISFWFKSESGYSLSAAFRKEASRRMVAIASYVPREFNRRPRSFTELNRWKATEFRFFLLYIGVYVTSNILCKRKCNHFVHFVTAMRTVCSKTHSKKLNNAAAKSIETFCTKFDQVYSNDIEPVYNTHCINHLVEDAINRNENLEDMNCFMFEDYLGQLKELIRTPNKPLAQVCKRLSENNENDSTC